MDNNFRTPPVPHTVLWTGLLVGLGFYLADILIDVFVFRSGTLREEFLDPTGHEIWMRTTVVLVAVAFSIYVQILLRREHETSERVRTAERFLNSVIDNIPHMIFIKDAAELRFVRINHTGEQLLGLTSSELMGKNDHDFFPEAQATFFTRKDRDVLESGNEANIPEEQIDTATHGKRWLHTRKVPILDDKGQPAYLLGISEDITEARQAEAELKKTEIRFQTLFNSAADCIFVIDQEAVIQETNHYASEHTGYEKQALIGNKIDTFFTGASQETCDSQFPVLKEQGYNRMEFEFVCKDGRILQMDCTASAVPDEDGCFTTFLIILRDVTDSKLAEKEIHRQQRELAHVMRLSTMGEMASGIAHELNQPLTALTSYCGTAATLAKALPSSPPQLGEVLERATEQAHRAGRIIWHLRDFLSKEDDHKEPVDIDPLVESVIDLIKPDLKNGHIRLEHHSNNRGCKVMANRVQIEQVLVNLVMNSLEAIKDSGQSSGKIVIQTRLLPDDGIETTVTDDGPGIAADMAGKLFNPFQTSKPSGMGMGLSISRSIIEGHDGKLWANEQVRNGASFGFSLPACVKSE